MMKIERTAELQDELTRFLTRLPAELAVEYQMLWDAQDREDPEEIGYWDVYIGTKGGLSDAVFNHRVLQEYLAQDPILGGYIGDSRRSLARDREVEQALRREGMNDAEIATLLTWKRGRWLAEDLANHNVTGDKLQDVVTTHVRGCLADIRIAIKKEKAERRGGEKCLTLETPETAAERSFKLAAMGEEQSAALWEWHSIGLAEERDDRLAVQQSEEVARELASFNPSDKGDPR